MRFIQSLFAGAALVAAAFAVEINDFPSSVEAGKSYTITYSPGDDAPTTFILRKGLNENLETLTTLTESATGGSFEWNVDSSLSNADDYALEIRQGTETNYIGPIKLTGGSDSPVSSAVASASSALESASSVASSAASALSSALSSASSVASSVSESMASMTQAPSTMAPSASMSISYSGNSTMGSVTLSGSRTPTGTADSTPTATEDSTTSAGAPESTGAASSLASSPLALIFGAVAAMAYLN